MTNQAKLSINTALLILLSVAGLTARQSQAQQNDKSKPATTDFVKFHSQLTESETAESLGSFKKLDDHPLYIMTMTGDFGLAPGKTQSDSESMGSNFSPNGTTRWGCSIFVSYVDNQLPLYGRNFDWNNQPAMVLISKPQNAYASISLVDISYLGFPKENASQLENTAGRKKLLSAFQIPFDGMNEHGLTVGMAAVDDAIIRDLSENPNVGGLQIIRMILDTARNTDEAMNLFETHDVIFSNGPNMHYLIADPDGNSGLVEIRNGEVTITRNKSSSSQIATNFYCNGEKTRGKCWRYDRMTSVFSNGNHGFDKRSAFSLLERVSQKNTQWSAVYDMKNKTVDVVMSRKFSKPVHKLQLN